MGSRAAAAFLVFSSAAARTRCVPAGSGCAAYGALEQTLPFAPKLIDGVCAVGDKFGEFVGCLAVRNPNQSVVIVKNVVVINVVINVVVINVITNLIISDVVVVRI